jgi:hypothetical protein
MCLICFRQYTPNLDSSLRVYESGASLAHFWAPDVKIRGSYGRPHGPLSTLSEAKIPISPQHRALLHFLQLTTACLPIYPPPPNSAHAPDAYLASDIDRPGGWEMSKTRSSGGAPCRVRVCSFRPPIVSRSRPQRARFLAAHDQSDGSTRPPYDLYVALRRGCRLAGVKHSSCSP